MILPNGVPCKLELHLTYRCDLACLACNRACFYTGARKAPDLTIEDTECFIQDCEPLICQFNEIFILGGEPTLNVHFLSIVGLLQRLRKSNPDLQLVVLSNGYSELAQSLVGQVQAAGWASAQLSKPGGSTAGHLQKTVFMCPSDFGLHRTGPCEWHSWNGKCGISVDSRGYTICPGGGMICDILGLDARRSKLADILNRDIVQHLTDVLCRNCGTGLDDLFASAVKPDHPNHSFYRETRVSRTWHEAFTAESVKGEQ